MHGATPLTLAVLAVNKDMCELLVDSFASISGHLFSNMPSPIEMTQAMELEDIFEVLTKHIEEDSYINSIFNCGLDDFGDSHLPPVTMTTVTKLQRMKIQVHSLINNILTLCFLLL